MAIIESWYEVEGHGPFNTLNEAKQRAEQKWSTQSLDDIRPVMVYFVEKATGGKIYRSLAAWVGIWGWKTIII